MQQSEANDKCSGECDNEMQDRKGKAARRTTYYVLKRNRYLLHGQNMKKNNSLLLHGQNNTKKITAVSRTKTTRRKGNHSTWWVQGLS